MLKKLFKQLFCKHQYEAIDSHIINAGFSKLITYKCNKCGKTVQYIF